MMLALKGLGHYSFLWLITALLLIYTQCILASRSRWEKKFQNLLTISIDELFAHE
jgi:hypothetical protein